MAEILPAILTGDYAELERRVRAAEQFASYLHFDITDGQFVASTSITANDLRAVHPALPFEVHLMVERPEDHLQDFLATGAQRLIIHQSSTGAGVELLQAIRDQGREVGLAVSPSTMSVDLSPFLPFVQQVTFVAVELGFQGGVLIPGALQRARSFRLDHPEIPLEADGGIKETNLARVLQVGADRYVLASAIWGSPDPAAAYHRIIESAQKISSTP